MPGEQFEFVDPNKFLPIAPWIKLCKWADRFKAWDTGYIAEYHALRSRGWTFVPIEATYFEFDDDVLRGKWEDLWPDEPWPYGDDFLPNVHHETDGENTIRYSNWIHVALESPEGWYEWLESEQSGLSMNEVNFVKLLIPWYLCQWFRVRMCRELNILIGLDNRGRPLEDVV